MLNRIVLLLLNRWRASQHINNVENGSCLQKAFIYTFSLKFSLQNWNACYAYYTPGNTVIVFWQRLCFIAFNYQTLFQQVFIKYCHIPIRQESQTLFISCLSRDCCFTDEDCPHWRRKTPWAYWHWSSSGQPSGGRDTFHLSCSLLCLRYGCSWWVLLSYIFIISRILLPSLPVGLQGHNYT